MMNILRRFFAEPQEPGSLFTREAIHQGVADVLAGYHTKMPAEFVHQTLSQGASHPAAAVRQRFYAVGLDILGRDFIRPALKDRSKKVRRWAERQLED